MAEARRVRGWVVLAVMALFVGVVWLLIVFGARR